MPKTTVGFDAEYCFRLLNGSRMLRQKVTIDLPQAEVSTVILPTADRSLALNFELFVRCHSAPL